MLKNRVRRLEKRERTNSPRGQVIQFEEGQDPQELIRETKQEYEIDVQVLAAMKITKPVWAGKKQGQF